MAELGDVLALLAGARDSFRTARIVLRGQVDADLSRTAMARLYGDYDGDPEPEAGIQERTTRVWIARGLGVRVEYDGPRAWTHIEAGGPHQIDEGPRQFLEPGPIIPDLRFELAGQDTVAGRAALVLRARPAGGGPGSAHAFGAGADEYELAVDAERGVVLRSVAFLDGQELERHEATELAFDEDLPAELFEEEREEPPEMARMTLGEVVSLVPFRVFAPARLGPSWSVTVWHQPAHEWVEPEHLRVELTYGGGAYEAGIGQHAAGARWPHEDDVFEWAPLEEGSKIAVGRYRADVEDQPSLRSVVLLRTEREGTSIGISSHTLPLEQLLDLLDRLEPV